ncbi:MAG: hypothetical protein J5647_11595 [Spirochaetaceae bacterium]|nr:hypothetical protein [Spirochaetaceae bacterium]
MAHIRPVLPGLAVSRGSLLRNGFAALPPPTPVCTKKAAPKNESRLVK